jgi:nitrite reductase/ring-hydroxylating ferredoxin subunit
LVTQIKACETADCPPGKIKGVQLGSNRLFVANVNGTFYACSARCTHMGGPLDEGRLEEKVVTCPWHGSRFDVTNGKVVRGPAAAPIPTFKVELKGSEVMVEI